MTDVQEETQQIETAPAIGGTAPEEDGRVYPGAPVDGSDGDRPAGAPRIVRALFAISLVMVALAAAYFVFNPPSSEMAHDDASLLQTTADEEPQTAAADGGASGADGAAATGDAQVADDAAAAQSDTAAQTAPAAGAPSGSGASAPDSPAASGQSGSSDAAGDAAPAPQAPSTISVRVLVDSSAANGSVSADTTLTFEEGATVYDALCATGLSVNARNSGFGVYVAGIGGLAEFDFGGESGWKYSVNGSFPGHSCSAHTLHDGDVVKWVYVTSL